MLLSEVLHVPVWCAGERVGFVIDARFSLAAGEQVGEQPAVLIGFVVGPRRGVSFLGYERDEMTAPALVAAVLRRHQRRSFLLDVRDVRGRDGRGLHVDPGFRRWAPGLGPHSRRADRAHGGSRGEEPGSAP